MNGNNNGNGRGGRGNGNNNEEWSWWDIGVAVAAVGVGVAAAVAVYDALTEQTQALAISHEEHSETQYQSHVSQIGSTHPMITDAVSRQEVSPVPNVTNLNSLLEDIHKRYVAIKKEDFAHYYNVFEKVFYPLHENMKKVDAYYRRYSSRAQFAGSHFDGLRIRKPDEFDMDIVIGVPVNLQENVQSPEESDIVIEPKFAGYVQLRAGVQYQNIIFRDGVDCVINSQAFKWMDDKKYILRSKFISWFEGVVDRALNQFDDLFGTAAVTIDGKVYTINRKMGGPAVTLIIRNANGFRLDVDLVPALRFPEARWLGRSKAYRDIPPGCHAGYWMVVPKLNKNGNTVHDGERSWRIAMHDQEKKFIHNSFHMRQVNRLLKKLRDARQMNFVESYYIKTLCLWKMDELNDPLFWCRDVATIFKIMLKEFHKALVDRKIRYFWNKNNNLLERAPENILKGYAHMLGRLITELEDDCNYRSAAKFLLTEAEYAEYSRYL